ncbi:MAG TPA: STAS domain-containing protein [Polyangia bacterium]
MSDGARQEPAGAAHAPGPGELAIDGDMTIYRALELKELLLGALRDAGAARAELRIDLGRVSEIDSAGIQLLMLVKHLAAGHGQAVRLTAISAAVRAVAEVLCLEDELGIPREEAAVPTAMPAADTSGQAAQP